MLKQKITIGIPAYNEEANITKLISSLLKQSDRKISIEKIIIYSDGSTDNTSNVVKSIRSNKILLIKSKHRIGQAQAQNKIFDKSESHILILLNADILINDKYFIEKLAAPIRNDEGVCLTSAQVLPVKTNNFLGKILSQSHIEKNNLYKSISQDNIYLCHGRARAFSKKLYKNFKFPKVIAEDAYSFLINQKMNFGFKYVDGAKVYFRSPENINDHLKQSLRFGSGINELKRFFRKEVVNRNFKIPLVKYIAFIFKFFAGHPASGSFFLLLTLYSKTVSVKGIKGSHIWSISVSSKKI